MWKAGVELSLAGLFCLSDCLLSTAWAQDTVNVASIRLLGVHRLSSEEILAVFQTKTRKPFQAEVFQKDLKRLVDLYAGAGFPQAAVESTMVQTTSHGTEVLIAVDEGKPAVISSMHFDGAGAVDEKDLISELTMGVGDSFVPSQLESDIQTLLKLYERRGYPFAKIMIGGISFSDDNDTLRTSVRLVVEEGRQAVLNAVRVEGNKTTKEYVVVRESRLRGDEVYTPELAEQVKRRLERLKLFSTVSLPELFLDERERAGLLIRVAEGNSISFDGVLGYVPAQRAQEQGYLTGLVDVQFRNLLGTGRKVSTRWYRENAQTQEIELHYFEPWLASYPVNAAVAFFQRKQDSTYVKRAYDVTAEFMVNDDLGIGVSFSQTNVFPSEGYGRSSVAESRQISLGGFVRYDSRDDAVTPTSGAFYRTEYEVGTKEILSAPTAASSASSSTHRVGLDLSYYFEPIKKQVVALESHLRDFRTEKIEAGDLFRLGGSGSLRGYREGQFFGSTLLWLNLEYRFLAGKRSFFYGFSDTGYIVSPDDPSTGLRKSETTKFGYGIGLRVDSGLGLIGVNIGFGEGDTFSTAKLHVRLMNEF